MENIENNVQDETSNISKNEINGYLLETSKWGKFLAIVGYVVMGILILVAIFMMLGFSKLNNLPGVKFPIGVLGFIYIIVGVIYYFPVTYLYRFSVQIKQGLNSKDMNTITSGYQNLKSLFKFMGILTIVILSIYGLILLIAIPTMIFFHH
jgi:hypothetical protein